MLSFLSQIYLSAARQDVPLTILPLMEQTVGPILCEARKTQIVEQCMAWCFAWNPGRMGINKCFLWQVCSVASLLQSDFGMCWTQQNVSAQMSSSSLRVQHVQFVIKIKAQTNSLSETVLFRTSQVSACQLVTSKYNNCSQSCTEATRAYLGVECPGHVTGLGEMIENKFGHLLCCDDFADLCRFLGCYFPDFGRKWPSCTNCILTGLSVAYTPGDTELQAQPGL